MHDSRACAPAPGGPPDSASALGRLAASCLRWTPRTPARRSSGGSPCRVAATDARRRARRNCPRAAASGISTRRGTRSTTGVSNAVVKPVSPTSVPISRGPVQVRWCPPVEAAAQKVVRPGICDSASQSCKGVPTQPGEAVSHPGQVRYCQLPPSVSPLSSVRQQGVSRKHTHSEARRGHQPEDKLPDTDGA